MSSLFALYNIYWREPLWLLLVLQPFIYLLLKNMVTTNNLSSYADKKLQPWLVFPNTLKTNKLPLIKNISYLLAWLLFSIALAGPRIPLSQTDGQQLFGANIMLVVDLSRSMQATDIAPNRLRRAKIEIYEFLEKAHPHRIGITVFSARPHLFVPLTSDHAALSSYLRSLDKLTFPTLGSNVIAAIKLAQQELKNVKGNAAIILITDGDFPDISDKQINSLKQANIPLYTLGVGTVEGEAIQLENGRWLTYQQHQIISRMNETNLQQLSSALNGKYSSVYDDDTDWQKLYHNGIATLNSVASIKTKQLVLWRQLFPYFLFPSLLFFWFSLNTYQFKLPKHLVIFVFSIIGIFTIPARETYAIDFAQTAEQAAYRAYKKERYTQADKLYQNLSGYLSYYGQGNSLYKLGHYKKAIQQYILAALNTNTNKQRANALYNLANSYFRTGQFSSAISTYKDVLRYQPDNKACLYNIKISLLLKKNIEQRLREQEGISFSSRQGKGPTSARIADGTIISDSTSVSVGESTNKLENNIPLPDIPDLSDNAIKHLLLIGLENIQFADQDNNVNKNSNTDHENTVLFKAQQHVEAIEDAQYLLWNRLFEIEEGFPAPVKTPRTIPGIKPW